MKHTAIITIPAAEAEHLQSLLDLPTGPVEEEEEIIATYTAFFPDGVEVDVKVCNGDPPYVDQVAFLEGEEFASESSEVLEGEVEFTRNGTTYTVEIVTA